MSTSVIFIDFLLSSFIPTYFYSLIFLLLLMLWPFEWSLGVSKIYMRILLKIFEFGRQKIEKAELKQQKKRNELEKEDCNDNEMSVSDDVSIGANTSETDISLLEFDGDGDELSQDDNADMICQKREFHLSEVMGFMRSGVQAIVDDEVTKRFDAEELLSWNLLTRTNKHYNFISMRLTLYWSIGFLIRYFILMPVRVALTFIGVNWLIICTAVIGCIPDGAFKRWVYWHASLSCFRILDRAFSAFVTYHNRKNMAKEEGICVANHTSPIDVAILACDNCYALVGQRQGGFLGVLQRALGRATSHIWFERFEIRDRELVTRRLREHVHDPHKLPILIFPEGTCINNSAVMMFKKGSFEVGGKIYPVAIKYDPRFGDPFWNSSKHGYMYYLLLMMTSWAIVCDVWYLPPMIMEEKETAIEFANRVKAEIARQGGLVDLAWDGQLKRTQVKSEWKLKQQEEFSKQIKLE